MIYGMALKTGLEPGETPVDAVVVLKYLDDDGVQCWMIDSTPTLSNIEALGMLTAAQRQQLDALADRFEDAGEE